MRPTAISWVLLAISDGPTEPRNDGPNDKPTDKVASRIACTGQKARQKCIALDFHCLKSKKSLYNLMHSSSVGVDNRSACAASKAVARL